MNKSVLYYDKKGMEIAVCLLFKNTLERFRALTFFH